MAEGPALPDELSTTPRAQEAPSVLHRGSTPAATAPSRGTDGDAVTSTAASVREPPRSPPADRGARSAAGPVHVRLFGSVDRGEDQADSDIDLIVDPSPDTTLFDTAASASDVEDLLGSVRRVDVTSSRVLDPVPRGRDAVIDRTGQRPAEPDVTVEAPARDRCRR